MLRVIKKRKEKFKMRKLLYSYSCMHLRTGWYIIHWLQIWKGEPLFDVSGESRHGLVCGASVSRWLCCKNGCYFLWSNIRSAHMADTWHWLLCTRVTKARVGVSHSSYSRAAFTEATCGTFKARGNTPCPNYAVFLKGDSQPMRPTCHFTASLWFSQSPELLKSWDILG